ncbi:tyrosine-type recombinase/integrase [Granulicella paludicola]|uniref:tyrosine-type recombinase/integrase n=1 Tax=Granulicella paludicola TaxID=474951 RepID=UPI0021DF8967|nr:tyrosine-type recombinase/integrase [Granulicella paludicola]
MKLAESIAAYVLYKQSGGLRYNQAERHFWRFSKHVGDTTISEITTQQVASYLRDPVNNSANWHANYLRLQKFFFYWTCRGEMMSLLMPPRPKRSRLTYCPYIYSLNEIHRILEATESSQARANCLVDARTLRTYLILLYATGARPCEVLDLRKGDVDLKRSLLTISNRRFSRSREVPIGDELRTLLSNFVDDKSTGEAQDHPFFADKAGKFIEPSQLTYSFGRLRKIANVGTLDKNATQPRLLDFKPTFAVHRIRAWILEGASLNRMLPALATYLGQSGLGATDKYLDLTPERFSDHIAILSPKDVNWLCNPDTPSK